MKEFAGEPLTNLKDFAIYLDLDGVLADYDAGIRGKGFNIDPSLKNKLNVSGTNNPLKRQMHESIKGTDFYQYLPTLRGAKRIWSACLPADPIVLTAAPKFGATEDDYYLNPYWLGAAYHKRRFVEYTFFSNHTMPDDRFICTTSARKQEFMDRKHSRHQILIDDRFMNCFRWASHGGFAILHTDFETTLARLSEYVEHHALLRGEYLGWGIIANDEVSKALDLNFSFVPADAESTDLIYAIEHPDFAEAK